MVGAALVAGMSLATPAASAASAKAPALTDEILPSDEPSTGPGTEAEGEGTPDTEAAGSDGSGANNEPEKQGDPEGSESSGDETATEEPSNEPTSGAGTDVDTSDKAASSDEPSQDADAGAETGTTPDAEATEPADEPTKQEQPENAEGSGDEAAKEEPAFEGGDSPPQAVQPLTHLPTFDCAPGAPGMLFQAPGGPPTNGEFIDIVTGQSQPGPSIAGRSVNAEGYNVLDDYVYGYDLTNDVIVQIGANGQVHDLGLPANLPAGRYIIGDIDENGDYWLIDNNADHWYKLDMDQTSATFNTVLDDGPVQGDGITNFGRGADWAYVPGGGDNLYRVMQDPNTGESVLFAFNRTTEQHVNVGALGDLGDNTFGAVYADPDGFLYGSENVTGEIYRIDVQAGTATFFAQGPRSNTNDGARCHESPIPIDFGDAPDSYGTTLASDGPRHVIGNYNAATNTAPLMLGSAIDSETDGFPSADADGDDADDVADEDGVGAPIVMSGTTDTTVSVSATNNTGEDAILAGWIDLDGNGTFDPGEMVTTTVPANSGLDAYDLTFPGGTVDADTFARFRLFPGDTPAADILPTGSASGGEVEDYPIAYRELEIDKTSDATADTIIGDTVTYQVEITNPGTADYTNAYPASFEDDLSDVLDDATFVSGSLSAGAGTTDFTDPMVSWEGPLAAGDTVTVTYQVELTGDGDGVVRNEACVPADEVGPDDDPCDHVEILVPQLEIDKSADATEVSAVGDTVTFTVEATNVGPGDYTSASPAPVTDDLTEVLDDATFVSGSLTADRAGTLDFTDPMVSWEGALASGETVTLEYTVTYTGEGDQMLENKACVPEEQTAPGEDPCDEVRVPAALIEPYKEVDPESGTSVTAGEELTYTVTFTNTGKAAGEVDYIDHAGDVFDDADLVNGPAVSDEALSVSGPDSVDQIHITGMLEAGQSVTVAYAVQVKEHDQQGDHHLGNFVTAPGESPPEECPEDSPLCTENPVEPPQTKLGALPITGMGLGASILVGLGVAMLLAGLVLVAAARRRRQLGTGERSVTLNELF